MQGLVCHKSTKYSEHNLPFTVIQYKLNSAYIDFVPSQVDLVSVNTKLNWKEQCDKLVGEANSRLGLLRYTCHFTIDKKQKITFYLAIARYIFVYCSIIWQHTISYQISLKFDAVQKKIKWVIFGQCFEHTKRTKYPSNMDEILSQQIFYFFTE